MYSELGGHDSVDADGAIDATDFAVIKVIFPREITKFPADVKFSHNSGGTLS
jgi:hypothetical protein